MIKVFFFVVVVVVVSLALTIYMLISFGERDKIAVSEFLPCAVYAFSHHSCDIRNKPCEHCYELLPAVK